MRYDAEGPKSDRKRWAFLSRPRCPPNTRQAMTDPLLFIVGDVVKAPRLGVGIILEQQDSGATSTLLLRRDADPLSRLTIITRTTSSLTLVDAPTWVKRARQAIAPFEGAA